MPVAIELEILAASVSLQHPKRPSVQGRYLIIAPLDQALYYVKDQVLMK